MGSSVSSHMCSYSACLLLLEITERRGYFGKDGVNAIC